MVSAIVQHSVTWKYLDMFLPLAAPSLKCEWHCLPQRVAGRVTSNVPGTEPAPATCNILHSVAAQWQRLHVAPLHLWSHILLSRIIGIIFN